MKMMKMMVMKMMVMKMMRKMMIDLLRVGSVACVFCLPENPFLANPLLLTPLEASIDSERDTCPNV